MENLIQESYFLPVNTTDKLHLKRICQKKLGPPVFMLHGSIENGLIFYSAKGKGLAPYLAKQGFDVYVGDLRGRGLSSPAIGRHSNYGQTEAITEDIPAFLRKIREIRGKSHQHWIAHSWGGVLLASYFARFEENRALVDSIVFFATKRCIRVFNWQKFLMINLFWNRLAPALTAVCGYLPVRELKLAPDNETKKSYQANKAWVKPSPWIDPQDHFDYGSAIKKLKLPPTLHVVGTADAFLGHPQDVQNFMMEMGNNEAQYMVLSKNAGNLEDYAHVNILTHPKATEDHYPIVLDWLRKHGRS